MADGVEGRGGGARLGAVVDGDGVSFGLFSADATAVDLCLFEPGGAETARVRLDRDGDVWGGQVAGLRAGQHYGYRVHGPWEPRAGLRFNPKKLLVDPYARLLSGRIRPDETTLAFADPADPDGPPDGRDSAASVPKGIVVADGTPARHARPRRPWAETVIYEAHVKGLTQRHPDLPTALRGTFAGLGHPALIRHLLRLGVTAIELLPVQSFSDDLFLQKRGLSNYWGYSTLNYFAPEPRFLGEPGVAGLKSAIAALHEAGIEVLLDVVLNHTAEADHLGPTLSFRGIDNRSYYKLRPDDPGRDFDCTGCGNTLDLSHPRVARLALDSLRHWAEEYGIDGFRFDLAPALARNPVEFDPRAPVLEAIGRDPVLSDLKLVAEPWDVGAGGQQLGRFPPGWSEWNDRFRDAVRGYWRGDGGALPRLAQGLAGSREIFEPGGRSHHASINYVTSHDGFTLRDLVSYAERHNERNGEGNRDGHGHNLSANHGHEGPSPDPGIEALRSRQVRNMLATVMLAQGVPMLLSGDEIGRSQGGNNNPYCQDNETSWLDWSPAARPDPDLVDFIARLTRLRRDVPALRRPDYLVGRAVGPHGLRDVHWLSPEGRDMRDGDWTDVGATVFGLETGHDRPGGALLALFNPTAGDRAFALPDRPGGGWRRVLCTAGLGSVPYEGSGPARERGTITVPSRSVLLFGWATAGAG